jgi:hypothetical protein
LGIAPFALPLLADQERPETRDLHLVSLSQPRLDGLENDLNQPSRLTIRDSPMALVDDARDVGLVIERRKRFMYATYARNFKDYMSCIPMSSPNSPVCGCARTLVRGASN